MAGFATMFTAVYTEVSADYSTWIAGLLTMFKSMLGGYSYSDFQQDNEGNPLPNYQYIYGAIGLVGLCVAVQCL